MLVPSRIIYSGQTSKTHLVRPKCPIYSECWWSTQNRVEPSFLLTNTTTDELGLINGLITASSISVIILQAFSRLANVNFLTDWRIGRSAPVSILWWTIFVLTFPPTPTLKMFWCLVMSILNLCHYSFSKPSDEVASKSDSLSFKQAGVQSVANKLLTIEETEEHWPKILLLEVYQKAIGIQQPNRNIKYHDGLSICAISQMGLHNPVPSFWYHSFFRLYLSSSWLRWSLTAFYICTHTSSPIINSFSMSASAWCFIQMGVTNLMMYLGFPIYLRITKAISLASTVPH